MPRTVGLILAGGRSTRFGGQDKAFQLLAGKPLIAHAVANLAPQVEQLAINSNADPARFAPFGLEVIPDTIGRFQGPLAGIHAGLARFPDRYLVAVAVDLPFLPPDLVAYLAAHGNPARCRYASALRHATAPGHHQHQDAGRRHALALLWPPGMANTLADFLQHGERSLRAWLAQHGEAVIFPPDVFADIDFNLNTPADLAAAEARLARHRD